MYLNYTIDFKKFIKLVKLVVYGYFNANNKLLSTFDL